MPATGIDVVSAVVLELFSHTAFLIDNFGIQRSSTVHPAHIVVLPSLRLLIPRVECVHICGRAFDRKMSERTHHNDM